MGRKKKGSKASSSESSGMDVSNLKKLLGKKKK